MGPPSLRLARATMPSIHVEAPEAPAKTPSVGALALAALGVVYGDIGTNPLFALQESFAGSTAIESSDANVLGVLSLVFWALVLVVSVKYLSFIMRAANDGEGGILALLALVPGKGPRSERPKVLVLLVLFGAALLYGDGVITPAISVLSAVEGLKLAAPALSPFVVPITIVILIGLFLVQKRGTQGIGTVFGPVMILWFIAIGALGAIQVVKNPEVARALDPRWAIAFLGGGRARAFMVLGGVVLTIAGGEALYADMGHFGRKPIAIAWYAIVLPCLLLNYFGQGAYLLAGGAVDVSPFYALVPHALLYPMIALATAATVIASQALISGAYSLTQQAVVLGFFPRVRVVHTSEHHVGQIFVPFINGALMVACVALVAGFGSSEKLASAYGLAVTGTMSITSIAYYVVLTRTWKWPVWRAAPLALAFLAIDAGFLVANLTKFFAGGWVPVGIGLLVFSVMATWMAGRRQLADYFASIAFPVTDFVREVPAQCVARARGSGIFMTANPNGVPPVLLHHFKHNQVLHQQLVLLSIQSVSVPFAREGDRVSVKPLGEGIYQVIAQVGFLEVPNVPQILAECAPRGLEVDRSRTSYYLGRETLIPTKSKGLWRWRAELFAVLARTAQSASRWFGIPPSQVVELGMQVEI
jgi:KUP system potassium uptake protein